MTVSTLVIAAVYPPLELSVRYYFFHRRTAGNNRVCMSRILCCKLNHRPFSDVNIFAFLCYILNLIKDNDSVFSNKSMHF